MGKITGLLAGEAPLVVPFQNWLHFKEAFSPQIVHEAIATSDIRVRRCIDPFGGSGTTAIACQILGVHPTTIEINPYLADLIEAKLSRYDHQRLVRDLVAVFRCANRVDYSGRLSNLPKTFVEPGVDNRWLYDRDVANRILAIVQAIEELELVDHRRFFRVLLGGKLVSLSNAVVRGKGRRYRRGWDQNRRGEGDVDTAFAQAASAAIGEVSKFSKRASLDFEVVRGDSREMLSGLGTFEIAVFSPRIPTHSTIRMSTIWSYGCWGIWRTRTENRNLREHTLSSHVQISRDFERAPSGSHELEDVIGRLNLKADQLWNRHIPAMVGSYFAELLRVVDALRDRVTSGGTIWAVVGDSSYGEVSIHVGRVLAELARTKGFRIARFEVLRGMQKSAQQGGQEQLAENLLVLQSP